MREQRMISLKNHVGGEKGSPCNPLMERGVKSGVKRERKPAEIEISGFCPNPDLLRNGLASILRIVQQDYSCSIHRLPVQSGPFPVFHQTG